MFFKIFDVTGPSCKVIVQRAELQLHGWELREVLRILRDEIHDISEIGVTKILSDC